MRNECLTQYTTKLVITTTDFNHFKHKTIHRTRTLHLDPLELQLSYEENLINEMVMFCTTMTLSIS